MAKVSVIIPMYNTESYIAQCIGSVTCQTYPDLEILIIDDGSTDRSLEICNVLRLRDDRIRIFKQEKKGVSSARNRGLEKASGKYVFFLDSDDVIHPYLLEEYVRHAEKKQIELTFCICKQLNTLEIKNIIQEKTEKEFKDVWEIGGEAESEEWFHSKFEHELSRIGGKMILRDTIGKERFEEKIFYGEDTVFIHSLISKMIRMAHLNFEWYYYRIHPKSVTHINSAYRNRYRFHVYEIIKNREYERGHISWALKWDEKLIWIILTNYLIAKRKRDKETSQHLRIRMIMEIRHPLFRNFSVRTKILFYILFFGCTYFPPIRVLWRIKQKWGAVMCSEYSDI